MNQIDFAALALVLLFAYKGYRTGFVGVLLGLTGGLLAFGMAAALAPMLAPVVSPVASERFGVPAALIQPALVIALTTGLRFLLGFAVRELASALGLFIRAVPPLALLDRLMGILPSAALGALLVVALALVALQLPLGAGERRLVEDSWMARNVVERPEQTVRRLRGLGERLVTAPPRVNGFALGAGVAGLAVAGFAATHLRAAGRTAALHEAPTRRLRRPSAEADLADPFVWVRVTFGIGVALAMAAALVFASAMR